MIVGEAMHGLGQGVYETSLHLLLIIAVNLKPLKTKINKKERRGKKEKKAAKPQLDPLWSFRMSKK